MGIEFNGLLLPGWLIGAPIVVFILAVHVHRKQSWPYIFCLSIFCVYLLKALDLTFFPLGINGTYVESMKTVPIQSFINLIPFYIGQQHIFDQRDFVDFVNNVLLTIPFGFGIIFVSQLRPKDFLWLAFAIGFGIETTQLLISLILRYPYRIIDINDALLNTAGVLLGYALFRIFAWIFIMISRYLKNEPGRWWSYVYEVTTRA
jgi:glycopeptide antibiotics resistance protein